MDAESVIAQFEPALARVVSSYERDRALQDDLLQEVLMAVLTSLKQLENPAKLKPFVFRIAHNRCLSHVAKRIRERTSELPLEDSVSEELCHEDALHSDQRSARLLEAVRRLELPYRQVITLLLEDMSYEDIAEAMGISVANVGIRVNRAKQQLKGMLNHER
jgi:RNA polymerase sigma-70 factor (ECF subfamily)